jgi:hypothetical protein
MASGESVYITSDAPPMLAALRKVGPHLWHLAEVEGPENNDAETDIKSSLVKALHEAGVRLVRESPAHALRALDASHCLDNCEDGLTMHEALGVGVAA